MTLRKRTWAWIAAAAALLLAVVVVSDSGFGGTASVLLVIAVIVGLLVGAWRLWRWATYRVGVRLLISYLLIGVVPLLFAAAFAAIGLYIMMGQYTSVRIGAEIDHFGWALEDDCEEVLEIAYEVGPDAALLVLDEFAADPPWPLSEITWWASIGGRTATAGPALEYEVFDWLSEGDSEFVARSGDMVYAVTAVRAPSGDAAVALIPFNAATAKSLSDQWWFDVAFLPVGDGRGDSTDSEVEGSAQISGDGITITVDGDSTTEDELWPVWNDGDGGLLSQPLVVWFRLVVDVVDLETGEPLSEDRLVALLRTSPRNVWRDFTDSKYELGIELWGAITGVALVFLLFSGLAMAVAAAMIVSITRSTSRLSRGAREIESGNLDYRVPVKRRDQLGDLARSFNHMTASVQSMLKEVEEKQRLAREFELARQIQERLLPSSHVEIGPLSVRAFFEPATEVGGDYFDVFSPSEGRMVVAIGDVAGHGLSAGLLMASVKSTVAALIHERYGGAELITRVNDLIIGSHKGRTLITLSLADIDLDAAVVRIANAGHVPPLLIAPDGSVEELLAGSLPIGTSLSEPTELQRSFEVGARLLLSSDGLVEALSADGEQFGYQRLTEVVEGLEDLSGPSIIDALRTALAVHIGELPLADDLTLLVIERNG
jgi:serine phosphatase RsbU (regulator of sigma subunit)